MRLQSVSPEVANNVRAVRHQIAEAAIKCGRDPSEVHLIAVSKTKPADLIRAAFAAGVTDFGENYLQEAVPKIHSLSDLNATWHFIGAIQSNKTRLIAENFHWVHTVSAEKTARRLSDQCPLEKTLDVCLQVNIDQDPSKAGVATDEVTSLLQIVRALPRLRVRGLMTVLQQHSNSEESYRHLATLWEGLRGDGGPHWNTLSMGMSGDFRAAISAGATHVRIGTAVFGDRI
jgi:pyridoxal phosphate enzyme (YggS family)